MYQRFISIIVFVFFYKVSVCQLLEENIRDKSYTESCLSLFSEKQLNYYYDSLKKIFRSELLTGYFVTSFNENASEVGFMVTYNDSIQTNYKTDSLGRFYLIPPGQIPVKIQLTVTDKNFFLFDTSFVWKGENVSPVIIRLQPRFKILLKGRIFVGSLPIEGANIEIVHRSDTFRNQSLSCFFDNENYWNCLYLGMFKQPIAFEDPSDSINITINKTGFRTNKFSMLCSEYNGEIIECKLKYDVLLPRLNRSNVAIRIAPPIFSNWMVSFDYRHTFKTKHNKLSLGIDGSMLVSNVTTKHATFREINGNQDTVYRFSETDSSYLCTSISPSIVYQLNNPLRRNFGFYAGLAVPYCFQSKSFSIQPFAGSRFFLDLNKAFVIELRYISYNLNVAHYYFNPYGNAFRYTKNEMFKKLILNIGLQVFF
jgi:hypothetical protein